MDFCVNPYQFGEGKKPVSSSTFITSILFLNQTVLSKDDLFHDVQQLCKNQANTGGSTLEISRAKHKIHVLIALHLTWPTFMK